MNPLEALLGLGQPPRAALNPSSRYYGIETATIILDDRPVVYLRRRFVPLVEDVPSVGAAPFRKHLDRLDRLADKYLNNAELFWRLCDAAGVMDPADLEVAGTVIRVPIAPIYAGGANG